MKHKKIKKLQSELKKNVAFVGDGINDALAMASSEVSVSMNSSAEVTFKSSSIHLLRENMLGILKVINFSDRCLFAIRWNLFLSFFYNIFFAFLALLGLMSPLVAVILMPLSSLTVVFLTVWNVQWRSEKC